MVTDHDLACGLALAVVLLLIIICVWPGTARAHPRDISGYWANFSGALFEIRPTSHRGFEVRGFGEAATKSLPGRVTGLRGFTVELPGGRTMTGRLDLGGRSITWAKGREKWIRQGIYGG